MLKFKKRSVVVLYQSQHTYMAQLPVSIEDAGKEIKTLITEKGIEVITSRMIRKHLEAKFNCDFEEYRSNLDEFIEQCIYEMQNESKKNKPSQSDANISSDSSSDDEFLNEQITRNGKVVGKKATSGTKRQRQTSPVTNSSGAKSKSSKQANQEDMATAIKRRRSNPVIPKKREQKPKTEGKSRKGTSAFSKICALSPELVSLLGKRYLRRAEVVKEMWNYFRSNNLQDPKNKQFYFLDEPLKKLFGKDKKKIKPFGMMATLKKHVKDVCLLDDAARQIAEAEIAEMVEDETTSHSAATGNNNNMDESNYDDQQNIDENSNQTTSNSEIKENDSTIAPIILNNPQQYVKPVELNQQPSTSTYHPDNEPHEREQSSSSDSSDTDASSSGEDSTNDY